MRKYGNQKFFQIPAFGAPRSLKNVVQVCDATIGNWRKHLVTPAELGDDLKEDAELEFSYYCIYDLCNIKPVLELRLDELLGREDEAKVGGTGGAAQTTVAVATIAFSMAMARLTL